MPRKKKQRKIYVFDTSVILYDHNAIKNFEDNDVALPITVLEELDNFKKGSDTRNYEAREFIRIIDKLSEKNSLQKWNPINGKSKGKFKVVMNGQSPTNKTDSIFGTNKNDHKILNAALTMAQEEPDARVTLVTKDINLRLKAKSLDLNAEDYETGKVKDLQNLYTGKMQVDDVEQELIDALFQEGKVPAEDFEKITFHPNHYYILKGKRSSVLAYYNPVLKQMERVEKRSCYGVSPRNAEQTFSIHAMLNENVKLVTLQGVAGTGKTLLSLATSIEQRKEFKQIYLARPIVPLSNKDIGYLPGDYKRIEDMVNKEKILVTPLAYIRGRSLSNVIFIVDEAQNLTPHEVKSIITRAGENTKMIFSGDIYQIDTPYLDEQSNGLSYLIDKLKGHELFSHITLEKGERSDLANLANEML
jgi:PhoH-like ATPase